jgi:hypothetical protein
MKKLSSLEENNCNKVATFELKGSNQGSNLDKMVTTQKKPNKINNFTKQEVWLTAKEGSNLLGISWAAVKKSCKKGKYITKKVQGNGGIQYRILLSSLPAKAQVKYWKNRLSEEGLLEEPSLEDDKDDLEHANYIRSQSPEWKRDGFDRNFLAYRITEHAKGRKEVEEILKDWNKKESEITVPESYQSIARLRMLKSQYGYMGFFPSYGKNSGITIVKKEWLDKYDSLYCTQGKPSIENCWRETIAYFIEKDTSLDIDDFPSTMTFDKQLKSRYSPGEIYRRRNGDKAYEQKYGNFIERDYSNVFPGECYVSDHFQMHVAVILANKKICFPWVTAWVDFRSGKWLGWLLYAKAPNSDHIFLSFYYAVNEYGIPYFIYIDNGKDYRVSDFSGGRKRNKKVSLSLDEGKSRTALEILGTKVIFANPYNPQSKSIVERSFKKVDEGFCRLMTGYRGGNIQKRPEKLKEEIEQNKLMTLEELTELFDNFIINVLNKTPGNGKILNGMSPDELWEKERITPRMAMKQSLILACMRRTEPVTIGKNGVFDSKIGHYYWGEWMSDCKGRKVYLRRDPAKYQEAWVFSTEDSDSFIGMAHISAFRAPALARTDAEKTQLEDVIARKKRSAKLEKAYYESIEEISNQEKVSLMEKYASLANEERGYVPSQDKPKVIEMVTTPMDKVIKKVELEEQERKEEKIIPLVDRKKKKQEIFFHGDVLSTEEWERKMDRLIAR